MEYTDKFIADTINRAYSRFPKNVKLYPIEMLILFLKNNQPLLKECFKYLMDRMLYIKVHVTGSGEKKIDKNIIFDTEFLYLLFDEPVEGYFSKVNNSLKIKNPYYNNPSITPPFYSNKRYFVIEGNVIKQSIDAADDILLSEQNKITVNLLPNIKESLISKLKLDSIDNAKKQISMRYIKNPAFTPDSEWFYYLYYAIMHGSNFERYSLVKEFFLKWKEGYTEDEAWRSISVNLSYTPVPSYRMRIKEILVEQLIDNIFFNIEIVNNDVRIKKIKFLNSDYVFLCGGMSYIDSKQNELYMRNQRQIAKFGKDKLCSHYLVRINKKVYFTDLSVFGVLSCHYNIEVLAGCELIPLIIDYGMLLINEKTSDVTPLINKFIVTINGGLDE